MSEIITCPHCQGQIQWTAELAGRVAQCPHCGQQFQFPQSAPSSQTPRAPQPAAPRQQAPPPLPQQGPPQAAPRPAPMPDQGYPTQGYPGEVASGQAPQQPTRRASRAEVKGKVFVPGLLMLIFNGLGALGNVIYAGIIMLQASKETSAGMDWQLAMIAILSVSFFFQAYVAYGGYELMNVRNYNTCFMAAILAILCTGQCFGMLAGIWALVALNDREVKSAMSLGSTRRFRR